MADFDKVFFSKEFLDSWYSKYRELEGFYGQGNSVDEMGGELERWVDHQRSIRHLLPQELTDKLTTLGLDLESQGSTWDIMFKQLSKFVQEHGHAFVPADQEHEA